MIMKKFLFIAFLSVILMGVAQSSQAQHYHCYKAYKKDWKSDKKEGKIHKKMWHDNWRAAQRKYHKQRKKEYKTTRKEFEHDHDRSYDSYW